MNIIRDIILYAVSILLGVMTVGGFMTSIPSGILFLLAALFCLPATHSLIGNLMGKKTGKGMIALAGFLLALVLSASGILLASDRGESAEGTQENSGAAGFVGEVQAESAEAEEVQGFDEETEDAIPALSDTVVTTTEDEQNADNTEENSTDDNNNEEDISVNASMEVHFIDVGQGDATLIKCGGQAMLIDAGDDTKGTAIWNYLRKQGVEKLDYLILTHPDSDHIGGAPVILTKFDVDNVLVSNYKKDTLAYYKLVQTLDDQLIQALTPATGTSYTLGNATFQILAPVNTYSNANDSSIALMVKHGENTFLFTGDAEIQAEADMLVNGNRVDADVYHVGHHGSSSASSVNFLNAVSPSYAVISCADDNVYGHPHAEVLNNLRAMGVKLFRTDEQGSVIAFSNGKEITWNCAPTDSWQAGTRTLSEGKDDDEGDTDEPEDTEESDAEEEYDGEYILNTSTKKFHLPDCESVDDIADENKETSKLTKAKLIEDGYEACKNCNP